jgi:ketosteroid isomerase-like protein
MAASAERSIELVRGGFEAFTVGDLQAVLALLHDDVEVHAAPGLVNAGTHRGHQGYLTWVTEWLEAWESFEAEPTRVEPIGDRHVLVDVRQTARGAGSGVEVEMIAFWAFEVANESVTRMHLYPEREQAVAAIERWRQESAGAE